MKAAVELYLNIHSEEVEDFMNCVVDDFNIKHYRKRKTTSSKVWFWGLHRWGRDFSILEYKLREERNNNLKT